MRAARGSSAPARLRAPTPRPSAATRAPRSTWPPRQSHARSCLCSCLCSCSHSCPRSDLRSVPYSCLRSGQRSDPRSCLRPDPRWRPQQQHAYSSWMSSSERATHLYSTILARLLMNNYFKFENYKSKYKNAGRYSNSIHLKLLLYCCYILLCYINIIIVFG